MPKRLEEGLERWGGFIARRRVWVLVLGGAALLALLALPGTVFTLRHLDANLFHQVSDRLPRFRLMRELSEDFGGDILAAVVQIPEDAARDEARVAELRAFGAFLGRELAAVGTTAADADARRALGPEAPPEGPWLRRVEARAGQRLRKAVQKIFRKHPGAVLTEDDVERLKAKFNPKALQTRLRRFRKLYDGATTDLERQQLRADPLALRATAQAALERRLKARGRGPSWSGARGYLLAPDHTMLAVLARPVRSANDLAFDHALLLACQRAENRALRAFRQRRPAPKLATALKGAAYGVLAPGESVPELRVGFTGMHAVSAENEMSLRWDLLATTGTSALAVLLLFLLVFRRLRLVLDIALTMGLAMLLTLALAALIQGRIGVLGAGFTCILLGMGVDYGIHLFSAFYSGKDELGLSDEAALRRTLRHGGPGILAASATSIAAFLGIATTQFRGLAELGLLAGIGLFWSAVLMLSVFPALLLGGAGKGGAQIAAPVRRTTVLLSRLHRGGRRRWTGLILGLLVMLLVAGLVGFGPDPGADRLLGVRFDGEFGHLRSLRIKAIPLRTRMAEKFGQGLTDIKLLAQGPDEASAFAAAEAAAARLQPWVERGEIQPSGGALDFLPSPQAQRRSLDALRALDIGACRQAFLEAAKKEFGEGGGDAFTPFLEELQRFGASVKQAKVLSLAEMLHGELGGVLSLFARVDGEGASRRVRLVSNYFPGRLDYPESWYRSLARTLERAPPEGGRIQITTPRMIGFELKASLFRDMEWISGLVALCVTVLLLFSLRSARRMLLAALPLFFGFLFVLGGVVAAQILRLDFALNYVNLMIFPVLLGSGIDYGVYLVFDACSPRRPPISAVLAGTGRGVLLCGLTTLFGFGSMILGSYTGLISFGWAAILGYTGALFGALIVLPSWLSVWGAPETTKAR